MNVLSVSAEVAPWSKTGGLADVASALPVALAARGHRVLGVAPAHANPEGAWDTGVRLTFRLWGHEHTVGLLHLEDRGCHRVFVDHPSLRRAGVYGDEHGSYGDNLFRFALMSRAAIEAARQVPMPGAPGGDGPLLMGDAAHDGTGLALMAHDWHAALSIIYLRARYQEHGVLGRAGAVCVIHNLAHQGVYSRLELAGLDLEPHWSGTLDMGLRLNLLKAGIVAADRVVTVSPTYADEIQGAEHGCGLDGVLRQVDLTGILNGVDAADWDPRTDKHLPAHFDATDLAGKAEVKAALQAELGLEVRADVPLLGFVGRLDHQKGVDLLLDAAPSLLRAGGQLALLGSGSTALEDGFRVLATAFQGKVGAHIGFDNSLAHRIFAGSDIVLMPSRFEPCGLNQLYALGYGTVPVVRGTGGLRDTVQPFEPLHDTGTGWVFYEPTAHDLAEAARWAMVTWRDHPATFRRIQQRGMAADFGWQRSAERYEQLLGSVLD